ncbi:MAG: response regulator [Candidatus Hodarchaeales archaeon]
MNISVSGKTSLIKKIQVLLVDDEPDFLKLTRIFLENIDDRLSVHYANSAIQALELLTKKTFDVIVSDFQMPGMDGLTFLERLRQKGMMEPFIVFTGRGREEIAIRALNLGANRYLQKGGDPRSQYKVLAQAINSEVEHNRDKMAKIESEAKFESILRVAPIGIGVVNEKREILFVSDTFCKLLGYSREELIGRNPVFLYPTIEEYERVGQEKYVAIDKYGTGSIDTRLKCKDGTILDVDLRSTPIDPNDRSVGVTFTALDISERKRLEKKLRDCRERSK